MSQPSARSGNQQLFETTAILSANATKSGRFENLAAKVHGLADRRLIELPFKQVDCGPGCSACCHRLVDATLPEVIAVAKFVKERFNDEEQQALVSRMDGHETMAKQYFVGLDESFSGVCPFLVYDRCTVHDVRPLSCRGLSSLDRARCHQWAFESGPIPFERDRLNVSNAAVEGIVRGALLAGSTSGSYELSGATRAILETFSSDQTTHLESAKISTVDKYSLMAGDYIAKFRMNESLSNLCQRPGFSELWESAFTGNVEQINILIPRLGDEVLTLFSALALPSFYSSQDELDERWAGLLQAMERFENARLHPQAAFDRLPTLCTFFWAYSGNDVKPLLSRMMAKVSKEIVAPLFPELQEPLPELRKPGRFRLGYLSGGLRNSTNSRWATGWLKAQAAQFETFAFNLDPAEDQFTNYWKRLADHYYHLPTHPTNFASMVRSLDLDALIITDIGMNRFDHQLTSLRLARKQFTAWGHPVTSGSSMIDGYLSSDLMEPEDAQQHYTERLYRLPGSGLSYPRASRTRGAQDLSAFGLPTTGYYFDAQHSSKRIPKHDVLYRQICEASGKPIAFLAPVEKFNRDRLEQRFRSAGVNSIIVPRCSNQEFLQIIEKSVAVLDTPAWNGGNSTIDALTLGKPVISMASEFMRGRHCLAFHGLAGVQGLVAKTPEEYVALALDSTRQRELMVHLNPDSLYDDPRPVERLNEILLEGFPG
jgi:hypothetical protein